MPAWNPLGFHLPSWYPHEPIVPENLVRHQEMIARRRRPGTSA
jgi:hypothetical protein